MFRDYIQSRDGYLQKILTSGASSLSRHFLIFLPNYKHRWDLHLNNQDHGTLRTRNILEKIIFSSWLLWSPDISETARKTSEMQGVTPQTAWGDCLERAPPFPWNLLTGETWSPKALPQNLSERWGAVKGGVHWRKEGDQSVCGAHWGALRWAESEDGTKVYKVSKSVVVSAPEAFLGAGGQWMKGGSHG